MATAPKVTKRIVSVNTSTVIAPGTSKYQAAMTNMSTSNFSEPEYAVDHRNRKERRKAESSKRRRRSGDVPQKGIYNAFRGY